MDIKAVCHTNKVQAMRHRPGQAVKASKIFRYSAHEGGKVSYTHRPPLPPPSRRDTLGTQSEAE